MDNLNLGGSLAPVATSQEFEGSCYDLAEPQLVAKMTVGTNWFYCVAGLSLVNTVIFLMGTNAAFWAGLGLAQIFDMIASQVEGPLKALPLIIGLAVAGLFALFGYLGGKGQKWAIITGIVLYTLDGLILLGLVALGGGLQIISLVIHGLALYYLFNSLGACRRLQALEAERKNVAPPPPAFGH